MLTTGHILRSAIGIVAFLTSLAAQTPTKEYIRLGGRVVAIENPQATIIVTVSPPTVTLQSGQTAQFTASVSGSPNTAVDWSLEPQGSGSISAQGLYTAPHLSAPLAVTVKATSQADPSRFATAFATVYPPSNQSTLISFTYPSQVTAGQSFQATVVMRNSGETTWQSTAHNPTMPHRLGSTNPTDNVVWGLHRVEATTSPVPPGNDATFVINATAPSSSGVKTFDWQMVQDAVEWFGAVASGIITVNPSVPSCTVSINPSSATVYSGRRLHLSATTSNCGTASVSWSISDGPGTLSANGSIATYTAPTGVTEPLTARIRVAVAGHSAESDATIAIHPSQPPALGGVSPGTGSGTRQVFTFTAFDAQGHSDINNFQAVIFSDWGYTCHFFFNPEYDLIALQSDSGTWPSQPLGGAQNLRLGHYVLVHQGVQSGHCAYLHRQPMGHDHRFIFSEYRVAAEPLFGRAGVWGPYDQDRCLGPEATRVPRYIRRPRRFHCPLRTGTLDKQGERYENSGIRGNSSGGHARGNRLGSGAGSVRATPRSVWQSGDAPRKPGRGCSDCASADEGRSLS
jgi:hypothetical protein